MPKKKNKRQDGEMDLLKRKCETLEGIIMEMMDVLPRGYTDIQRLQVRAMRAMEWSNEEIKAYARGE